jgi:hypothetical protein
MEQKTFTKPHLTGQHRQNKTRTNILAPSWIQTHDTSGKKLHILSYVTTKDQPYLLFVLSSLCKLCNLTFIAWVQYLKSQSMGLPARL